MQESLPVICNQEKASHISVLESDDDEMSANYIADTQDGPLELLQDQDTASCVRASLSVLPEKYRIILSLFYFESLSYEEIAETLCLPINTVCTHIKRAKEALKTSPHFSHLSP